MSKDIKVYTRRDSCTTQLRKLGVGREEYDIFIEKVSAKEFHCDLKAAQRHLDRMEAAAKPKKESTKPKKEPKVTISSLCRSMIIGGATNEEVFKALQEKFGEERFGPDKRYYPAWYRCEVRRAGTLPPMFDYPQQRANDPALVTRKFED